MPLFALTLYLAAMLGMAGLVKLARPSQFAAELWGQRFWPRWSIGPLSRGLPWLEVGLALALVAGVAPLLSAVATALLFTGFLVVKLLLFRRRSPGGCGCFGKASTKPVDAADLTVAVLLMGLTLLHLWLVATQPPVPWEWRAVAGGAFALFGGWLAWRGFGWRLQRQGRPLAPTTD